MINLRRYMNDLSQTDVLKICGVKFENGEEILISDDVPPTTPKHGNTAPISIPIRWFNFCYSVFTVAKTQKLKGLELAKAAIEYAKRYCFDFDGTPINLAKAKNYSSYSKMLSVVETEFRTLQLT